MLDPGGCVEGPSFFSFGLREIKAKTVAVQDCVQHPTVNPWFAVTGSCEFIAFFLRSEAGFILSTVLFTAFFLRRNGVKFKFNFHFFFLYFVCPFTAPYSDP